MKINDKNPVIFWGKVIGGKRRGRTLGFPTANIKLHKNISAGVYTSLVKISKITIPSLTFIGNAKTFGENEVLSESYFLTKSLDVYRKWISVRLLEKIRGNIKFKSANDLTLQMEKDKQEAKKYFKL